MYVLSCINVVYIISCYLYSSFCFQALRGFCNMRYINIYYYYYYYGIHCTFCGRFFLLPSCESPPALNPSDQSTAATPSTASQRQANEACMYLTMHIS